MTFASSEDRFAVGIDFGGTKMLGSLVRPDGTIVVDHRVPTPYNGDELLDAIADLTLTLEQKSGLEALGVGVGAAGLVDRQGVLHYGPNVGRVTDVEVLQGGKKPTTRTIGPGRQRQYLCHLG